MTYDSITSERFFYIFTIVLLGVGSYLCLLGLVLLRNVCKLYCARKFTPEQLIDNKALLPKYVRVDGKVTLTRPLISRFGGQPNCFIYRSTLTYNYNTKERVWVPSSRDENGHSRGGYYRNEVVDKSQDIINEKRTGAEFDLVGEDDSSRISVEVVEPFTVNFKYDGSMYHKEKRGKRNSSDTSFTFPQNPNDPIELGTLPLPHSRSSIELYEKWIRFEEDDDRLVSVYGIASERDGSVIMSPGGFNNRMIIEGGSPSKWVWCMIFVWVLTLLTLPTGLFFFFNPETVELPWFPNEPEE
jgi:hypothetical protein